MPYQNNMDCQLKIQFAEGQRVSIQFSHFELEANSRCVWDWLEIRDGDENVLGKFCGGRSQVPDFIQSNSNTMTLVFHSDSSVTRSGFILTADIGMTYSRREL